ncbi:MAG: hypothetical protein A3F84_23605 [Candidatus Handelsmanbacteria bacterium RIFCSPLOWO2_12_FULL_64_10]|uniref:Uncharacterized protein n=1 Tax=Handelsmanbacteria sp. (strain RIFCSPLOWO2_12_FULL_64_10) TaxID=1817868 RepID=A0A1F6D3J3_HANXR|nr:MAG: hypothetical protein A3F84_23605 [Candidatus Handelsmanbacteria bacterium RIFCSPLOWO2_12_FULL_64_10]
MDLSWVFYALVLFITGGMCFFTAITTLIKLDRATPPAPAPPSLTAQPPPEPPPRLTRLGRPVRQIQLL